MENEAFENIEVIAYFRDLNIRILRFKWKETVYNVSHLNSKWKVPVGEFCEYHFSVVCGKQKMICELSYNLNDFRWQLVQWEIYD
jgi:hypothetical protein